MDRLVNILVSTKTMTLLLFIFAAAIGTATFIENSYDTATARVEIYNSKWFELVMVLLVFNFIGNIKRYRLLQKSKLVPLTFHLAFIVIIIGAAITRYVSFEGLMLIKEQTSSNLVYSSDPNLQFYMSSIEGNQETGSKRLLAPMLLSAVSDNDFEYSYDYPGKGLVKLSYVDYHFDTEKLFLDNQADGVDHLELMLPGREEVLIKSGSVQQKGGLAFAFNDGSRTDAIQFHTSIDSGKIGISSPYFLQFAQMSKLKVEDRQNPMGVKRDTLYPDSLQYVSPGDLLFIENQMVAVREIREKGGYVYRPASSDNGVNYLEVQLDFDGKSSRHFLRQCQTGETVDFEFEQVGDMIFKMGYGSKEIILPFHVRCNDFIMQNYPGSSNPMSYESELQILDSTKSYFQEHRIFMNHVLDYEGYRLFQSKYAWSDGRSKQLDPDMTVLSVNHDILGTTVTYIGYTLLFLCLVLQLFNPKSRFLDLRKKVIGIRGKREKLVLTLLILVSFSSMGQKDLKIVPLEEANKFGELIVQHNGRYQPVHTLAYDICHKLTRKDKFDFPETGKLDAMQLYLDLTLHPEFWIKKDLIKVKKKTGVGKLVRGEDVGYVSVWECMDTSAAGFKLRPDLEEVIRIAHAKRDVEKSVFDKELIQLNDRVNIFFNVLFSGYLKIYPVASDSTNKWVGITDSLSWQRIPLNDTASTSYYEMLFQYRNELLNGLESGDYSRADGFIHLVKQIQRNSNALEDLPSESMVGLEVMYNQYRIFGSVVKLYAVLAVLFLIFALIENLSLKKRKVIKIINLILMICIGAVFLYHAYGLVIRWIITGHAPWSNGYEALVFIAWVALLAGFAFVSSSKITLGAATLLGMFVLMTTGHQNMDPQLSNLVPVLQSYWLVIHVACITASYAFFGLGFIQGIINLFIMLFENKRNRKVFSLAIDEMTFTSEMSITIGLVLAAIGTFLGGIWANESWGRYWGWDAKETWALVIVIVYSIQLHLRFVPGLRGRLIFNALSVLLFGSVIMTYFGVNYFLTKGLHSYAQGDEVAFPTWVWITIFSIISLIVAVWVKRKYFSDQQKRQVKDGQLLDLDA